MAEQLEATLSAIADQLGLSRPTSGMMQRLTLVGEVDGRPVELRLMTSGTERRPPYEPGGVTGSAIPLPERKEPRWVWRVRVPVSDIPRGLRIRPLKGIVLRYRWRSVGCVHENLAVRAADMDEIDAYLTPQRVAAICEGPKTLTVSRNRLICSLPASDPGTDLDAIVAMVRRAVETARALSTSDRST